MVREVLRPRAIQRPCVIRVEIVTKPARFFTCDDALHMGVAQAPVCTLPLLYTTCPCVVPIIRLPGINLAGFPSENGRESMPYKTEKALLSEPIFTLLPTGI